MKLGTEISVMNLSREAILSLMGANDPFHGIYFFMFSLSFMTWYERNHSVLTKP